MLMNTSPKFATCGIMPSHDEEKFWYILSFLVTMTWPGVPALGFVVSNPPVFQPRGQHPLAGASRFEKTLKRSAQSFYWQNDATHLRRAVAQFTQNSPFDCDQLRFYIALKSIFSTKKSANPLALTTLDEITLCNRVECFAMSCFFSCIRQFWLAKHF